MEILTVEEIEDLWELDSNSWHNRQLFANTTMPEAFLRKHWGELSEAEHYNCFVHQKLSTQFFLDYWSILTENERKACFEHQNLSTEFLEYEWGRIKPDNRIVIARAQILTPEFIISLWPLMDWWWKVKVLDWQKNFPARLVVANWEEVNHALYASSYKRRKAYYCGDLTMAELPEYLSCELDAVRTSAEKWLCELQRRQ